MPPADDAVLLLDTSVAVALSVAGHEHHERTSDRVRGRSLGLAGHAVFETFSVLSRLPPPARRHPATIARMIETNFPHTRHLTQDAATQLFAELAPAGVGGGAVYDALVGAVARQSGLVLLTRDRRAADTYRALGVRFELID